MKKALLAAGGTLLAFLVCAIVIDLLLPVTGIDRVLLWAGLGLFGIIAAVLVYLYLSPAKPNRKREPSDVDLMLATARRRLVDSESASKRLSRMPVTLLVGPPGSAKSTLVAQSAVGPELLAGQSAAGGAVAPTQSVNLWYTEGNVVVEAGGTVPDDSRRWTRLLRALRPSRWAAALGGGRQPPRVAVVCFSCEELVSPGSSISVPAAARKLRDSLAEVSRAFGVRLPVYVVFTKTDRLAGFEEFVRHLTPAEAQELLGATLPLRQLAPGEYADAQGGRLGEAFDAVLRSLAHWRLEVLPREGAEASRTSAYEFPRELAKIRELAASFLLELGRPSQLEINPFLRGFYFTGVRPIHVSETVAQPRPSGGQSQLALGATAVFAAQSAASPAQPPAPSHAGTRRVPDWVFLRRIMSDIVLADERAQSLTAGGARVDVLRRGLLGAAAVFLLVLAGGMSVSYANNRALLASGQASLAGIAALGAPLGEAPPATALIRLDSLRAVIAQLSEHERSGRPLRLRWGLYTGDAARGPLRLAYFDRFATLLWNGARDDLLAQLQALPVDSRSTEDYTRLYAALKAYLVTTSHPQESTPEFLTPTVLASWRYTGDLEPERHELVTRQVDFFARELPLGNPYPAQPSESLVVPVRDFLQGFTVAEPFYEALVAEASESVEAVRFDGEGVGSGVVASSYAVPAAYTERGWERVQTILGDLDSLLDREDWVLGERASIDPAERNRLAAELRTRYLREYVSAWRDFLTATTVARFAGPADAAGKLTVLASNRSPLLQLLAIVSRHTAVDTTVMRQVFQPVHSVIPAGENDRLVTEGNGAYMSALVELQSAMTAMAETGGAAQNVALTEANLRVEGVSMQARELAANFNIDGEANLVGAQVQRLLEAPATAARTLVRDLPTASVNAAGARFCTPFNALSGKYPFNEAATLEATIEEVTAALQPGNSALWSFYDEALAELLVPQGSRYVAAIGADPQPSAAFTDFFNRAASISRALFPEGVQGPTVRFALTLQTSEALPEIRISMDGQTHTFTRTNVAARTFTWEGARARTFRVTGLVNGMETALIEGNEGPWTLVRVLRLAEWQANGPDRYTLRWPIAAEPGALTATITFPAGTAVFAPGEMRLACTGQILR